MKSLKIASLPTIKRLPSYLHVIENAQREGREFISGTVIADELDLEPIQVRKDLAITGIVGKPRIGFPVQELIDAIYSFLHWNSGHTAVVVGAGSLATALMGYPEFPRRGLNIVAGFDVDKRKAGTIINEKPVYSIDELSVRVRELDASIAILTVPSSSAQEVAERIIDAGISAIWNFTNVKLKVPAGVLVQKEDLSSGYAVLSVKIGTSNGG
ncbi:MAG: redox-sensing transcriptional repressor Rex [Spirochaetales bacterium]